MISAVIPSLHTDFVFCNLIDALRPSVLLCFAQVVLFVVSHVIGNIYFCSLEVFVLISYIPSCSISICGVLFSQFPMGRILSPISFWFCIF